MLLAALAVSVSCLGALWCGGRLAHLASTGLGGVGLLLGGAALELAGSLWGSGGTALGLILAGYVLLLGFAVVNIRFTGMILIAIGLSANLAVFATDGAMPVRGVPPAAHLGGRHRPERPGDALTGLADIVPIGVLDETVSAGDIALSLGAATIVWTALAPTPMRRKRKVVANR